MESETNYMAARQEASAQQRAPLIQASYKWLTQFLGPADSYPRVAIRLDNQPQVAIADSGSTRCLISSGLLATIKGPNILQLLLKKKSLRFWTSKAISLLSWDVTL